MGVFGSASSTFSGDVGVWGESADTGLYGETTNTTGDWGLYTPDDIRVASVCTGCASAFVARNGDRTPLEVGDVVAIIGVDQPLPDSRQPVMVVRKAGEGDAVVGAVYRAARLETLPQERRQESQPAAGLRYADGTAAPGDLLVIVTHGPTYVKVAGPVEAGDLLVAGAAPGVARSAQPLRVNGVALRPDGVLGRVLGPADPATGLAPVLMLLQ
jgi:hypothetical protein